MEEKLIVSEARKIAAAALEGLTRGNGRPFIEHADGVARIVSEEIGLPSECVDAIYLHESCRMSPGFVIPEGVFSRDTLKMVEGLNRIALINPRDTRLEAENYKKLIVSYSTDPRVTILKLADRLEVMRSLDIFPKASRERKILETLMLYIPLAHQLGLYNMKSEMEDIYFRFAEPEQYRAITNRLKAGEADRQRLASQFIEPLKAKLTAAGIAYKLKERTKTAFSIWKKMQKQKVGFDGVFDVFAIRFIIDTENCSPLIGDDGKILEGRELETALCWKSFSYVTEKYESDTKRLRDWLTVPKPNGYESLHITVKNADGVPVEVQIRTKRMDEIAESGLASHWSYKGIKHEATLDNWLAAVRYSLEHGRSETLSPGDHEGDEDLPEPPGGEIFVFTPSGELRRLSAGATVLDFAFEIHTNLGLKCVGGKVNGKAVPIREKLKTGDYVEITSGKNQKPSADWLNFTVTSKARNKIRQKLKEEEFKKASEGKERLEKKLKGWKLEFTDELIHSFLKKHSLKTVNALYAAIGEEEMDPVSIKEFILDASKRAVSSAVHEAPKEDAEQILSKRGSDDILVIDAKNVKNLDYRMAKCCHPVFGDDVFGFVTRLEGVKIHRISCPNAARLIQMYPYRIQKVRWSDNPTTSTFQANLKVVSSAEQSVINDIMSVVSSFKASIRAFNVAEDERHGNYVITMKLSVSGSLELDKVVSQIRAIKSVSQVTRL